jgi:hypothetical protein
MRNFASEWLCRKEIEFLPYGRQSQTDPLPKFSFPYRISSRFRQRVCTFTEEMPRKQKTEKDSKVCELLAMQHRLAESKNPFVRRFGTILTAGVLDKHLAELSDRQIGQLMFDHVGHDLGIAQPEMTICQQATHRLFRSTNRSLIEQTTEQLGRPPCPKCGNEMLFHYGIDEPDFNQCVFLGCEHKEYVRCDRNSGEQG